MAAPEVPPPPDIPTKSRFTYRHLGQLAKLAVDCPLRVIAHVDLDAFYAQCEMKRLGVPPEEPLAVQQWQNLIAVNYPARAHGITRHITGEEARKLCPNVKLVHVATWIAGETHWAYHDSPSIEHSKVCLDPYRVEGKKILDLFRAQCAHVEKASVDESFLDLSAMVHERLLQRYSQLLAGPPPYNDPTELLPLPGVALADIDWHGSHLVDSEEGEVDGQQADWDDVAMAIGTEIIREVRESVRTTLGYTCSAGISVNKMLAKLGSAFRKPDQQSVVRQTAVQPFLNTFKFTKIRNLGGKLGSQITDRFHTDSIPELLKVPLGQFASLLADDTATWFYNVLRGIDRSPVTNNTALGNKSMMSAKSFRAPSLPATLDAARAWLRVLVADLASRCEDEGVMEGRRRPRTMTFSLVPKDATGSRSRQVSLPAAGAVTAEVLLTVAEGLLRTVVADGRPPWPCVGMVLQVGRLQDRETGNQGIGAFLVRRGAHPARGRGGALPTQPLALAKRKPPATATVENDLHASRGIGRFFAPPPPQPPPSRATALTPQTSALTHAHAPPKAAERTPSPPATKKRRFFSPPSSPSSTSTTTTANIIAAAEFGSGYDDDEPTLTCPDCDAPVPVSQEDEHRDWHFAKSLLEADRAAAAAAGGGGSRIGSGSGGSSSSGGGSGSGSAGDGGGGGGGGDGSRRGGGGRKKMPKPLEKGQRRLAF